MTRSDLKTGRTGSRTPFQILADYYQSGDTRDRDLWREFSRVTRALCAVRWSRGPRRSILGLDADNELTDEDLAAESARGRWDILDAIDYVCRTVPDLWIPSGWTGSSTPSRAG